MSEDRKNNIKKYAVILTVLISIFYCIGIFARFIRSNDDKKQQKEQQSSYSSEEADK